MEGLIKNERRQGSIMRTRKPENCILEKATFQLVLRRSEYRASLSSDMSIGSMIRMSKNGKPSRRSFRGVVSAFLIEAAIIFCIWLLYAMWNR